MLRAQELRKLLFQFLMNILRAANKSHCRHAESSPLQRLPGRRDDLGMIGQSKIVIRAEVEHSLAAGDRDARILGAGQDPFALIEASGFDLAEFLFEVSCKAAGSHLINSNPK